jgi:selenium-binding protein 1
VNVVVDVTNLASSIWTWYRDTDGTWRAEKTIEIEAVPTDKDRLPPILRDFGAVPPLVTDIALSLDDRYLYVSCWGTGELRQYDVSDPLRPKLTGVIQLGGILHRAPHPSGRPFTGAPQMIEVSRDGRRLYGTNSLYSTWDDQFYPEGISGAMFKVDIRPEGGMSLDPRFYVEFGGARAHQVRLEGGDCSTDSFCFV